MPDSAPQPDGDRGCGAARERPERPPVSRADIESASGSLLHDGGWGNPDVLLLRTASGPVVVKDFAARSAPVRTTWGRWMIRRELRAHRRLLDLDCVPRVLGSVDRYAFAMEYRPGSALARSLADRLPENFLADLEKAVSQLHRRGVVHLDLRHRSNILADAAGRPVLIDFGASLCFDPRRRMGRWLVRVLGRVDRRALEKWRRKFDQAGASSPHALGAAPGRTSAGARGASRPM